MRLAASVHILRTLGSPLSEVVFSPRTWHLGGCLCRSTTAHLPLKVPRSNLAPVVHFSFQNLMMIILGCQFYAGGKLLFPNPVALYYSILSEQTQSLRWLEACSFLWLDWRSGFVNVPSQKRGNLRKMVVEKESVAEKAFNFGPAKPGWEQGWENGYMHIYGWVPSLFIRN